MPGLEDLYREIILDHYRTPRNRGTLDTPPAVMAQGHNPLCGDEIQVYLLVSGDTVADVKVSGQGCSISQSARRTKSAQASLPGAYSVIGCPKPAASRRLSCSRMLTGSMAAP